MEESMEVDENREEYSVVEMTEQAVTGENASVDLGGAARKEKNPSISSEDDDSGSDNEDADELQIEALENSLAENPFDYEAHVQYIQHLRKLGHIEKLREARESMNEHFPLPPKMWQDWTKDESSLSSSSEDFTKVEKLYERGVYDYLSVPLWCDYLDFVQEHDQSVSQCSPTGVLKMRNLFERAITAAGLHVVEGDKIWEAYREFEQAIFLTIAEDNNEEKAKQVNRIRSLFHRQLSVPLVDLKSTLMAYKLWEVEQGDVKDVDSTDMDGIPSNVVLSYQKATEMYKARTIYEDPLLNQDATDNDKLQHFMNYIKFEESSGDPARVQILFERGVSELPVSSDLWVAYTSYLDRTLKVPDVLKNVYSRATKNCSWVGDLWVRYMLSLERICASEEELSAVFEKSLQCSFPSFKEYMDLFLTRVDGLRRRASVVGTNDGFQGHTLIRDVFQRAIDYLSPEVVSINDLLNLHAYWARLEANLGNDLIAARGVWESLIKKSGSLLEVWQAYIAMEIEMGHIIEARSIYKRCYSKRFPGTGSEDICYSWLRFEREYGNLDDYDLAVKKVTPRLQELIMFKNQQEHKNSRMSAQKDSTKDVPHKRKMTNVASDKQSPAKKQKRSSPKSVKTSYKDNIKQSDGVRGLGENDKVASLPEVSESHDIDEKAAGSSYSNESKSKIYKDQCTAFISNLGFQANEGHLREFFADCGGVTAIRILKDKFTGKSRGLAYVDFSDERHLKAAVAKNKQRLLGQKLSIARSDPARGKKRTTNGKGPGQPDQGQSSNKYRGGTTSSSGTDVLESHETNMKPKGSNTFAAPRAVVRPLGWTDGKAKPKESLEPPKSNDQFREMLLKQ
ncbi:putative RNA recognition motif domain, LSM-interacting domain, RNA-binding domain superfamily [Dioscorea sansibarensis]